MDPTTNLLSVLDKERDNLRAKATSLALLKIKEQGGSPEWCSYDGEELGLKAGLTALARVEQAMAPAAPVEKTMAAYTARQAANRNDDQGKE